MNIVYKNIDELKPYKFNARNNKKAIKYVENSIKRFGMKVPIVIDRNGVIVCGHTRYEALKNLGTNSIPCIIADDLNEKQIKAFRLADNKTAEKASWDFKLLEMEFEELDTDFDMADFGFDFDVKEKRRENKHQEMKTVKTYNMLDFDEYRTEGIYQMPTLEPCNYIPERWIGFNYAMSNKEHDCGVHFYLDDYQFERVWTSPERYIEILSQYEAVMTPSYSVYMDMATPLKIWNVFRSRLLGQMMQDNGLNVIPIVYWADDRSYKYCFDGLPENSTLSVYTIGIKDADVWRLWKAGMDELIKRKHPKTLLLYGNGNVPDYDFGKIKIVNVKNDVTERMMNID